jgi:glycine cleavage system H protein
MEGFTYTNIFETKGIEYLFIITFFAILIPFWLILNKKEKRSQQMSKVLGFITPDSLRIPQGVFFSKFHTWAHLGTNGVARVGIDDLLLHFTGEVTFESNLKPGDKITKGEIISSLNHKGKILQIKSPISGEIMTANEDLADNLGLLQNDPYRQGWMFAVKPNNWKAETQTYFLADEANNWIAQELAKFKDFLSASVLRNMPNPSSLVLQDGGEIINQPLAELPQEVWSDFQKEFLD